ncbi:carboxypeptidase regulatory-like domain-containing protein, partial [Methanophagales archaeon]
MIGMEIKENSSFKKRFVFGVVSMLIAICVIALPAAAQSPPTPFKIYGWINDGNGAPVLNPNVRVTNLDTSESWTAKTNASYNYYRLVLMNSSELEACNTLRIIAINESATGYHIINVSDYPVTAEKINDGGIFNLNLTLNEFYLDLKDFPMYQANASACPSPGDEYHKMCGPATAQMNLNYMWWNSSENSEPPLMYNQSYLYNYGISHNANTSLPY